MDTSTSQATDQVINADSTMNDDYSFNEKYIEANEFISPLSGDLVKIQNLIQSQLEALNGLLANRNSLIYQQITAEYSSLTKRFLVTLEYYLGSTLVDLFQLVDRIAPLMENYDYDLEIFEEECTTTPQDVEQTVQDVKKMVEIHATTVSELSVTAMELSELGDKFKKSSQQAKSASETAGAISISLAVGGAVAGAGTALFFAPFVAVGTVLAISAGGGGISGLFHLYDKKKSEAYTDAAIKLDMAKECSDRFKSPISAIHHDMATTGRGLATIQRKTKHAINPEKTVKFRLASYEMAQCEAKRIKEACIRICGCSLSIAEMKGRVSHRVKQIE